MNMRNEDRNNEIEKRYIYKVGATKTMPNI
jgi:hypothetical protein